MDDNTISRHQLLARIAWMYYQDDQTQAEIAEKLGFSRVTINRMIKEARELGLVEIKIKTDFANIYELSSRLCKQYGLLDVICVRSAHHSEDQQSIIAQGAAAVLSHHLQEGITVGIGVGRTISFIPDYFGPENPIPCRFISLTGGLDLKEHGVPHSFDTITRLAIKTGGEVIYIPAPSYLADPSAYEIFMQQPAVINALQMASSSQMAFFSVGATDYSAILFQMRYLNDQDMNELKKKKAVGDVLGRFYDVNGEQIQLTLNKRTIGLEINELKKIPLKILVAGGVNKVQAIKVAMIHKFCDILVTDEETALRLLNHPSDES
ncbi:MAG: sugar-binding transcriptional regulator [Anaerolineaceae bacterium]|nr:sugar-binding transcriptional regulator [Anaerolineaceae bacterium]